MKNLKNKLLLGLALANTAITIIPNGGGGFGGGFATGALTGALITTAATSGSRRNDDPGYYEYRRERADQARADRLNRRLDKLERNLERAKTPEAKARIQREIDRVNAQLDTL